MRFYTNQHQFYYGIDVHARSMDVYIVCHAGEILTSVAPYLRPSLPWKIQRA